MRNLILILVLFLGLIKTYSWYQEQIPAPSPPTVPTTAPPQEPDINEFEEVVATLAARTGQLKPKCFPSLRWESTSEAKRTLPGFTMDDAPGFNRVELVLRADHTHRQQNRDLSLRGMEALADLGFYSRQDAEILLRDDTTSPGRRYTLTQTGWLESENYCFRTGRQTLLELVSYARIRPDPYGIVTYEVVYRVGTKELPLWYQPIKLFFEPDPTKISQPTEYKIRLFKGKYAWLPEFAVVKDLTLIRANLERTLDELLPDINLAETARLVEKTWSDNSMPSPCLMLPVESGADAEVVESGIIGPYSASYPNNASLPNQGKPVQKHWIKRLQALVNAGIMRTVIIPEYQEKNHPSMVKYILNDVYRPFLSKEQTGCLRMGNSSTEFLQVEIGSMGSSNHRQAKFKAMVTLNQDAWARTANLSQIADAATYLEYGMAMTGILQSDSGPWKVYHVNKITPKIVGLPVEKSPVTPSSGPVHVISIYQGESSGTPRGDVIIVSRSPIPSISTDQGHPERPVRVNVRKRGKPLTLVLSAYEPVKWILEPESGVNISRVVLLEHHPSSVFGVDPGKVERNAKVLLPRSSAESEGLQRTVERLVGRRADSVQTAYEGKSFVIGTYSDDSGGGGRRVTVIPSRNK